MPIAATSADSLPPDLSPVTRGVAARAYWTAFIGLFFDYYDLYLFVYLEHVLAGEFALSPAQSHWLQFAGLAGVGAGALLFGYLADRRGRARTLLAVFGVYAGSLAGLSLAWNYESLLAFRILASLSLGAEWGISHAYLAERVGRDARYRFAALLQFSILGGLLAALAAKFALPAIGWRWLFAASIAPVALLSLVRGRTLAAEDAPADRAGPAADGLADAVGRNLGAFLLCFALASLTIASGTINVFYAKELPQGTFYTIAFWGNVAPGMLAGAWIVRRWGVGRAMALYAAGLLALSLGAWGWAQFRPAGSSAGPGLAFALVLPLLNGIPFGLMGAWFNEVFREYRTLLSGAAYNLGRILAGFAPVLLARLGLNENGRYFLFTAGLGVAVLALAALIRGRVSGRAR